MATPFSALESRLNAVALWKLSNATATIDGQAVNGVFDAEYQEILGVSTARPTFAASSELLAGVVPGTALAIACPSLSLVAASFTVTELHQEHGVLRLWLRKG